MKRNTIGIGIGVLGLAVLFHSLSDRARVEASAGAPTSAVPLDAVRAVANNQNSVSFMWRSQEEGPAYKFEEEVNVEGFSKPLGVPYKSSGWFRMRGDGQIEAWVAVDEDRMLSEVLTKNADKWGQATAMPKAREEVEKLVSTLTKQNLLHKWVRVTE